MFQISVPSPSPSPPSLRSATTPPVSLTCLEPTAAASEDLEGLCKNEFGFKLSKVRAWLHFQSEEHQSALLRFRTDVRSTEDSDRRREIAKSFIMDLAAITELANDRFKRLLVKMQDTSLANVQRKNEKLIRDIVILENEIEGIKDDLSSAESENEYVRDEASRRFAEKKDILEVKLREELQACQICRRNSRNIVVLPCLHAHFCGECMEASPKTSRRCPTCNVVIRGILSYIAG